MPAGQTGIRLREALAIGDAVAAAALAPLVDEPHRIELLLGAAIRDRRLDFAAAHLWLATDRAPVPDWLPFCRQLVEGAPDHSLDDLASAYVAEGRVSDRWEPLGRPFPGVLRGDQLDLVVADALAAGVAGEALLSALATLPLFPAVAWYYRRGTIHALGPRPLLILAASAG